MHCRTIDIIWELLNLVSIVVVVGRQLDDFVRSFVVVLS